MNAAAPGRPFPSARCITYGESPSGDPAPAPAPRKHHARRRQHLAPLGQRRPEHIAESRRHVEPGGAAGADLLAVEHDATGRRRHPAPRTEQTLPDLLEHRRAAAEPRDRHAAGSSSASALNVRNLYWLRFTRTASPSTSRLTGGDTPPRTGSSPPSEPGPRPAATASSSSWSW